MHHIHGGDIYSYAQDVQIRDFSANINFRGMPEAVRTAAVRGVDASLHYPDPACRALRQALARRENTFPEQIICGNGAAELIFALMAALRPRSAFLAIPSFFEYEQALTAVGCEIHSYLLHEARDFLLTEDFCAAIPAQTDIIILGNPNNPTGRMIPRRTLLRILETCQARGIFLVLDESFFDFLEEADWAETLEAVPCTAEYRNLFILKSFTKMYAMPGLRFGYGICSDRKLLAQIRMRIQPWNVSVPAQLAARAAAAQTAFAAESAAQTAANRRWMKQALEDTGVRVFDSSANFLLFTGPPDLKDFCLAHGFLIRDCSNFPGLSQGCFRICIRSQQENEALLAVIRRAVSRE